MNTKNISVVTNNQTVFIPNEVMEHLNLQVNNLVEFKIEPNGDIPLTKHDLFESSTKTFEYSPELPVKSYSAKKSFVQL